jgi:hypothetical protein
LNNEDASPEVRAVYDDIMATRKIDWVNNFWKAIAHDSITLKRTCHGGADWVLPHQVSDSCDEFLLDREVAVRIADTGCGIPAENIDTIFDRVNVFGFFLLRKVLSLLWFLSGGKSLAGNSLCSGSDGPDEAQQFTGNRRDGLSCIPGRLAFVETEDEGFILERPDPQKKREYIRFVIGRKDDDSHVEQGIFQAAAQAVEWQNITGADADELNELRAWFSENLEKPTSFGRDKLRLGICWFKIGSAEHISRIWEMVHILERNGIYVKTIRTDRPGYVTYEDEWQLVAEPFRKGTLPRR